MSRRTIGVTLWGLAIIAALGLSGIIYADQTGLVEIGADTLGPTPLDTSAPLDTATPQCVPEKICNIPSDCGSGETCQLGCCVASGSGGSGGSVPGDTAGSGPAADVTGSGSTDNPPATPDAPPETPEIGEESSGTNPPATPGSPPDAPQIDESQATTDAAVDTGSAGDQTGTATKATEGAKSAVTGPMELVVLAALVIIAYFSLSKFLSSRKYRL